MNLTKIPEILGRRQRDLYDLTHIDSITRTASREQPVASAQSWAKYFDNPSNHCILQAPVLEEIVVERSLSSKPSTAGLIQSAREGLERIHNAGVFHGNVGDLDNVLRPEDTGGTGCLDRLDWMPAYSGKAQFMR